MRRLLSSQGRPLHRRKEFTSGNEDGVPTMPRPRKIRSISSWPRADYFKPRGLPLAGLAVERLSLEEYEAMRLYDVEGMDQEGAAARMGVSRPTFGRMLSAAHGKVARALALGRAIQIEGGTYRMAPPPGGRRGRGRGGRGWRGGRNRQR